MRRIATTLTPVLGLVVLTVLACRPTATVERTTPVADLRIYRTLALRVGAARRRGRDQVASLEQATAEMLRRRCSFNRVATEPAGADLLVDVNIQRAGRGGDGLIRNENIAYLNALVVLTDAIDGELIGSAVVKGKSSAVLIQGNESPEDQAVDVVARTVADILVKSGCEGTRTARTEPAPAAAPDAGVAVALAGDAGAGAPTAAPDAGASPADPGPTDPAAANRAAAEAANEDGKRRFRAADVGGALAAFERAVGLIRDPRYLFNVCLAHEALEQLDRARAVCEEVRAMRPPPSLAAKVDQRLAIIAERVGRP